jgi:hypothetical protein
LASRRLEKRASHLPFRKPQEARKRKKRADQDGAAAIEETRQEAKSATPLQTKKRPRLLFRQQSPGNGIENASAAPLAQKVEVVKEQEERNKRRERAGKYGRRELVRCERL